jgi:hypothetical protein
MGPCVLFLTTHTSFALGISSSWEPGPQQCRGPQNNRWILTKRYLQNMWFYYSYLKKYIRHFRTSRKARYFKKPVDCTCHSREDKDPHTEQWLSFEKRRLQLTSRAQDLFSSFSRCIRWCTGHTGMCRSCCHSWKWSHNSKDSLPEDFFFF